MSKKAEGKSLARFNKTLIRLLQEESLSLAEARRAFTLLFTEALPVTRAKSFLLLLTHKGETADELLGCLQALQALEKPLGAKIPGLMDTCGTGGDGQQSINISTLVALVIAGAGGKIAKHGNRAISSKSGSSDLMESFGVKLNALPKKMLLALKRSGLGYFHAPVYHPVFSRMQPLRQTLKRRTILNLLGPLVNPMRLDYQLVGVAQKKLVPLYAKVLSKLGRKAALVCHSEDGMDEISTSAPTTAAWVTPNRVRMTVIQPRTFGLQKARHRDLAVDSVKKSKRKAEDILNGTEQGPARDTIVLNAAYGLLLCGKARSVPEGIRLAQNSLDSGKARNILKQLKTLSN